MSLWLCLTLSVWVQQFLPLKIAEKSLSSTGINNIKLSQLYSVPLYNFGKNKIVQKSSFSIMQLIAASTEATLGHIWMWGKMKRVCSRSSQIWNGMGECAAPIWSMLYEFPRGLGRAHHCLSWKKLAFVQSLQQKAGTGTQTGSQLSPFDVHDASSQYIFLS